MDTDMIRYSDETNQTLDEGSCIMSSLYIGKERRATERRIEASKRRESVRYKINKSPHRSGKDHLKVNG